MVISPPQDRAPQHSFQAGANLDGYTTLGEIAVGELSTVHLARRNADGERVAIKRLRAACAGDPVLRAALIDEGRVARKFDSPHVTRAVELKLEPEPLSAFDYVEGLSLAGLSELTEGQDISRYVVPILVDALTGLQTMHLLCNRQGEPTPVFHQAPSARHILVGTDGTARLIDLSHVAGPGLAWTDRRNDRLRPEEMAPEQVLAPTHIDARCDVFIVGVALWEALTGERLFLDATREETVQRMLRGAVPAPSQVSNQCPVIFDRICDRALQRAPWRRFDSAADMADALVEVAVRHDQFAQRDELATWIQSLIPARDSRPPTVRRPTPLREADERPTPVSVELAVSVGGTSPSIHSGRSDPPRLPTSRSTESPKHDARDDPSHVASGTRSARPPLPTSLNARRTTMDMAVATPTSASAEEAKSADAIATSATTPTLTGLSPSESETPGVVRNPPPLPPLPSRPATTRLAPRTRTRARIPRWTAAIALGTASVVGALAIHQLKAGSSSRELAPPPLPDERALVQPAPPSEPPIPTPAPEGTIHPTAKTFPLPPTEPATSAIAPTGSNAPEAAKDEAALKEPAVEVQRPNEAARPDEQTAPPDRASDTKAADTTPERAPLAPALQTAPKISVDAARPTARPLPAAVTPPAPAPAASTPGTWPKLERPAPAPAKQTATPPREIPDTRPSAPVAAPAAPKPALPDNPY